MTEQFPIGEVIPEIKQKLALNNTLILQAPPGAGKSTVLPLELLNEPWLAGKKILMLEPRRLAAKSVAARMASLLYENVGETIGYRIRFDNKVSNSTRLEVLTEGILTRMLQNNSALDNVGLVIFDEFHERSLHADLALALCREMQQILRDDLRILIMSATLDGDKLSSLLGNAPITNSFGRQYPITHYYIQPDNNSFLHQQMAKAIVKAISAHDGDVLAFLPGAAEIQRTQELLESDYGSVTASFKVQPLYGDLPFQKQQEAILPDKQGRRKIVLATPIAETSLTIEGIKIVVDSGYCRTPRFDPKTGLTRLETIRITQDMAAQRAGRAGRITAGVCYRLWSELQQQHMQPHRIPEILEADMAPTIMELAQWGVKNVNSMAWLNAPPAGAVSQAQQLLHGLGALETDKITQHGKEMLRLPTHPRIAHLLLKGKEHDLLPLAIDIAAVLEERDPLPKESGTNITLRIDALRKWRDKQYVNAERSALERIEKLANQWRKIFSIAMDNTTAMDYDVGKLIAAAYPERIAKQREQGHRYRLANGKVAKINEYDALSSEQYLAIAHIDAGTNEGKIFLAAPLASDDIVHLASETKTITWDSQNGVLIARNELRIGDIILSSTPLATIPEQERLDVLCQAVKKEGWGLFDITDAVLNWKARISSLRQWCPDEVWPDLSNETLMEKLNDWLAPFLINVKKKDDFQKLDMLTVFSSMLTYEQQQILERLAPAKIDVPSGSSINLSYHEDGSSPVLAVRLQEMFGLLDTPTVNGGTTKVLLHLLSPGYKPVQVTQDLKSFWQNTYPEVRKELRVRYSKHYWPEDPWTAEAVRGVKRNKPQ